MLVISRYPFLRILPAFIAGIIIYEHSPDFEKQVWWILLFTLALFTFISRWSGLKPYNLYRDLQGIFIFAIFLLAGYATPGIRYHSSSTGYFSDSTDYYSATVVKYENRRGANERYIFEVDQVHNKNIWVRAKQRIIVNLQTEEMHSPFPLHCKIIVEGQPRPVNPPLYSSSFNYKKYLARKNIHFQQYIKSNEIYVYENPQKTSLHFRIYTLHEQLKNKLKTIIPEQKERNVALAMLLGDKSEIDQDVRDAYGAAGVAHILAVSGLHTGIVFLIVSMIFSPLKRHRSFSWLYYIIVLASIWFYALLTGLSPSVTRASLMLSFVLVGSLINGKYQVINSIAASAFFILLIQPWLIFSVSFQLSYLAVFGIVLIYSKLHKILVPPEKVTGYIWKIICVSIAAQIATFPLVVYYFHQFSPFFIASNIFVIPAAALIISIGMIILVIDGIGLSIPFLNTLLEKILYFTNQIVFKIESLPGSHIDNLYLDFSNMLLLYLFIAVVVLNFYYFSKKLLLVAALSSLLLITGLSMQIIHNQHQNAVVVYSQPGNIHVDFIRGNKLLKYKFRNRMRNTQNTQSLSDTLNQYNIQKIQSIYKSEKIFTSSKYDLVVFKGKRFLFLKRPIHGLQKALYVNYLFVNDPNIFHSISSLKNLQFDQIIYTGLPVKDSVDLRMVQIEDKPYYDIDRNGLFQIQL